VARDVRAWRLEREDGASFYLPVTEGFGGSGMAVIAMRIRGSESRAVAAVRSVLQASHPELQAAIGDARTAYTTQSVFIASRLGAIGAAVIGMLGLLMTAVGIYGTVGFAVAQRTREIGIRMALGAARADALRLVLAETMRPVGVGMAAGFAAAVVASRLMHAMLFGLSTLDPAAFLGVSGFLAAVALLAAYVPARRATRVDPMVALRYE
jgi:predicted lysophospholipase L1 biosynthesis ABC-type transport system permease subunit